MILEKNSLKWPRMKNNKRITCEYVFRSKAWGIVKIFKIAENQYVVMARRYKCKIVSTELNHVDFIISEWYLRRLSNKFFKRKFEDLIVYKR